MGGGLAPTVAMNGQPQQGIMKYQNYVTNVTRTDLTTQNYRRILARHTKKWRNTDD
jgi:hypothetical protein